MATERRTSRTARESTGRYRSYGNVAYQPEYEPGAARAPERRTAQPQTRPRIRPREHVAVRPVVEVRQQSPVALFAVVGFAAVAVTVVFLLSCAIQLSVVADQTFDLQDQLVELKDEEKKLLAQYEAVYDLSAIERELTASGAMVRAGAVDTVYLDMAEADSVTYHSAAVTGISGMVDRVEDAIRNFLAHGE